MSVNVAQGADFLPPVRTSRFFLYRPRQRVAHRFRVPSSPAWRADPTRVQSFRDLMPNTGPTKPAFQDATL
jgi:hypothetical protein